MRKLVLALALSLSLAGAAPAAELVVNGGFETGDFTGWTLTGATDHTTVDPNFAYDGFYGASLAPVGADGYLSQILPTIGDQTYTLSYALENVADTDGNVFPNDFGVLWGGVLVPGSDFLNSGAFSGQLFSLTVTAPGPNTELQFYYRQDPGYWGLDVVSVQGSASPEPSSLALASLGLLAVVSFRKFRQQFRVRFKTCFARRTRLY